MLYIRSKVIGILYLILTVSCSPALVPTTGWVTPSSENYSAPNPAPIQLASTFNPDQNSESENTCPGSITGESNPFVTITADVSDNDLVYCIQLTPDQTERTVAPQLIIHLPAGVQSTDGIGAGWVCEVIPTDHDDFISDPHDNLSCLNAVTNPQYPKHVQIKVIMPESNGEIRMCAEVVFRSHTETLCITTQ